MLIKFSIQNFGSIKEKQTLSFEADKSKHLEDYYVIQTNGLRLLKLGLIYGANASGKTTVLKAFDFLRTLILNPKSTKTEIFDDFEPFKFDEYTPTQNTFFETEFFQNDVRYLYNVELNNNAIVREELYSCNHQKTNIFKRITDLQNRFTKIEFGNKIKIDRISLKTLESSTLWNNTVFGGFLKTNIDNKELMDVTDWFKFKVFPLVGTGDFYNHHLEKFISLSEDKMEPQKSFILDMLKKADFNINDMIIKKEKEAKFQIDVEHKISGKNYVLPFQKESQGTKRYYLLTGILSLLCKTSCIIPVDELEASLHPDLFIHFLLSFLVNAKQSQIIAATHNREILNNKDIFRNDAIWITDKNNQSCATELYSLADFDTNVIKNTTNIFNAYKIGKLGGVPNLGDYYIDFDNDENDEKK
ncbi:MAG: ATP-binding protein [Prevotellaceae bacterium]|jgi:AAA15 family ATPase/GTPase|nr:ATP-binding protein [Prevotellaceae bacterium]